MNEITTSANTLPANIQEMMAADIAASIARLGSTGGKDTISILQNKKFVLPDETQLDELNVVILDFAYRNEYYEGAYNPKDIKPPACAAVGEDANSLVPFDASPKRQSTACTGCQQDAWGSSPTGDGKACKNAVGLAVLPAGDDANSAMYFLKASPTAITAFNQYVAKVARDLKMPVYGVATRIFFDPKSTYATIRFEVSGPNAKLEDTMRFRPEAKKRVLKPVDFTVRDKK